MSFLRKFYSKGELPIPSMTDEALFKLFIDAENMDALGELYKRYSHLVFGVCMNYLKDSELAKDACMQIFEDFIFRHPAKPITKFKNWLFVVSRNHCLMYLRQQKTEEKVIAENFEDSRNDIMESENILHLVNDDPQEIQTEKLHNALSSLTDEQKTCIQLFFLEGLSYKEIADKTGYDSNQVKSFIQNGKRNLKIILENGNNRS